MQSFPKTLKIEPPVICHPLSRRKKGAASHVPKILPHCSTGPWDQARDLQKCPPGMSGCRKGETLIQESPTLPLNIRPSFTTVWTHLADFILRDVSHAQRTKCLGPLLLYGI